MQEPTTMGSVAETDNLSIYVNYSDEAKEKELLKFVPKGDSKEVVISADDILGIIATQLKKKDLAVALTTADISEIPMIETIRPVNLTLERDWKKGEVLQFTFPHMYPYFLAVTEEAYGLAKTRGEVGTISKEILEEAVSTLMEKNKPFIEAMYADAIKKTNKK